MALPILIIFYDTVIHFSFCSILLVFLGAASIKGNTRAHKSWLLSHVRRFSARHLHNIRFKISNSHWKSSETDTGNAVFCWKFGTIVIFRKLIRQKFVFNIHQPQKKTFMCHTPLHKFLHLPFIDFHQLTHNVTLTF